jgi:hypothetical protein
MKKAYYVLELTQLDAPFHPVEEGGLPPIRGRNPVRQVREVGNPIIDFADDRFELLQPKFVTKCYSLAEAEEYCDAVLQRRPDYKLVVLESTALFEIVATPTIRKGWDENGQYIDKPKIR